MEFHFDQNCLRSVSVLPQLDDATRLQSYHRAIRFSGQLGDIVERVGLSRNAVAEYDRRLDAIEHRLEGDSGHFAQVAEPLAALSVVAHAYGPNPGQVLFRRYLSDVAVAWKRAWFTRLARYRPENNGRYPFQDVNGNSLKLKRIMPKPINSRAESMSSAEVLPFVRKSVSEPERMERYDRRLRCRRIKASDVPMHEHALIGQLGVFAERDLPRHACVGVYGGTYLTADAAPYAANSKYLY